MQQIIGPKLLQELRIKVFENMFAHASKQKQEGSLRGAGRTR